MNIKRISNVFTSRVGRQVLVAQKHSPVVLFGAGIIGVAATVVLACRATLKLDEIVEKAQVDIEAAHSLRSQNYANYSEADCQRDLAIIYTRTAVRLGKLYAPAFIIGVASVGALVGSHAILSKRNVALTAAYAGLERAFKEYRQRVIDEIGEEKEQELRYASVTREIVEKDETGKEVTKVEKVIDPTAYSPYARFFDEYSQSWSKTPEINLLFLRSQQNYANDLLKARGHVFLNEVYDMLGIARSKAGAIVGWVISKNGDNFVDFHIYDGTSDIKRQFVNGNERSILLDFNVDGVIYDKI